TRVGGGEPSPARVDEAATAACETPTSVAGGDDEPQRTPEAGAEPSMTTAAPDVQSSSGAADNTASIARAVDRSLAALAETLGGAEGGGTGWDAALGATAGSLPEGAAARLVRVFQDGSRPIAERLVAAELLRKLGSERGALTDGATIDDLRRLALGSRVE